MGLANESEWRDALPLAKAILEAFTGAEGVEWSSWKKEALEKYRTDKRLTSLWSGMGGKTLDGDKVWYRPSKNICV